VKSGRPSTLLRAVVLGVFLVFTLLIAFGHTEKTPFDESRCMACHFLGLLLQTAPALFVFLISFVFFSLVQPDRARRLGAIVAPFCFLRAPPAA